MTDDAAEAIEGRAALAARMLDVVRSAQYEVRLLSYELERGLYGGDEFADAVKTLLLASERARLRVLLNQSRSAMRHSERLIELGRRLSSRCEFRELPPERLNDQRSEWLIADTRNLIERRAPDSLVARAWIDNPGITHERIGDFDKLWDESVPAQELRSLGI